MEVNCRTHTYHKFDPRDEKHFAALPFVEGGNYICFRDDNRGGDSDFKTGEIYECVKIEKKDRFSLTPYKDWSTVKFKTKNGNVISYFGGDAINHFTDDKSVLKKALEVRFRNNDVDVNFAKEDLDISMGKTKKYLKEYEEKVKRGIEIANKLKEL